MSINPGGFTSEGTFSPDNLQAGDHPVRTLDVTLASGQNHVRGALLGAITADGKYTLSASASVDGSEEPVAVLAKDTDASGGDEITTVYVAGDFNERDVVFGAGHTADSVREALAQKSIYLLPSVAA